MRIDYGGGTLKKRILKISYFIINGVIAIITLNFSKRYLPVTDNHFFIKVLIVLIIVLFLYAINHYIFMKAIFGKKNEKS